MKDKGIFQRVFRYDMRVGVWQVRYRYGIAGIFLIIFIQSTIQKFHSNDMEIQYWDVLYAMFEGIQPSVPGRGEQFDLPVLLIVFELLMFFIVGNYSRADVFGYGRHVLLAAKSKRTWWLSKCVWVIGNILLYYALAGALLVSMVFLNNPSIRFGLSSSCLYAQTGRNATMFLGNLVFLPILTSVMIGLLQMLVGFVTKPIFGYASVIALLVISSYSESQWLAGNYLMMLRNRFMVSEGVGFAFGVVYQCILIGLIVLIGVIWMNKKDVLEGGGMS